MMLGICALRSPGDLPKVASDRSLDSISSRIDSLLWYNERRNNTIKLSFRGIEDACDIIAHDPNKDKTLDAWTNKKFEKERFIIGFTEDELEEEQTRQCQPPPKQRSNKRKGKTK